MGFDEGRIVFDRENLTYYAGEVVHGKLVFDQSKNKSFRGIYIKMKGECHVHWKTSHSRQVDGRTEHYTTDHNSHEVYFEQKIYLVGGPDGDVTIPPGHYEYPFQCLIPDHCPSSIEKPNGNIRYTFKVVVDRSFKFDQEKCMNITVIKQKDLNRDPYCKEPMVFEFQESYCCWCMSAGSCEITVSLPQSGYCPGQTVKFDVNCTNNSNVEIDLKFEIIEQFSFRAVHNPDTRSESNKLAKLVKGPIGGNTTRNWTLEMDIPQMDVYNLDSCQYIDVNHIFEVKVGTSGCHSDTEGVKRIVIGNVPLREFEDNGPPQPNIIAQPMAPQLSQFPGTHVQPGTHPAYPNNPVAHPYLNQQYPGNNQGYPPNSPFPPNPYPNSPYPPQNSPYPPQNSPYPPQNTPYHSNLPMVSPVPGANPPGVTSPYPGAPYPGNQPMTSPYPAPGGAVQPGFAIPGSDSKDPAGAPLLHPSVQMPYPPQPPIVNSPYATASAPEPGTPDFKNYNPPFNPEMGKQQ